MSKGYPNAHLLVSAQELARLLDDPGSPPLILDLRPPDAYTAGHVPRALHLDLWGVSLVDTDPAPLAAFMWMIEHVLAVHGVEASAPVVVYDDQSGIRAARAFWFLEYFGHPSVRMLDGGFGAWTRAGLPVSRDALPARTTDWTGGRVERTLATWRDVRAALESKDAVILDTRTDGEYCGTTVRAKRWGNPRRRAHRVDAQPHARRQLQARARAPADVRGSRRHAGPRSHHLLPGRLSRRAFLSRAAPARVSPRAQLRRIVEGVGRPHRPAC
jgi:thiosulfate/3-mercaptopyruvate sulfurtransferase